MLETKRQKGKLGIWDWDLGFGIGDWGLAIGDLTIFPPAASSPSAPCTLPPASYSLFPLLTLD